MNASDIRFSKIVLFINAGVPAVMRNELGRLGQISMVGSPPARAGSGLGMVT
jgi:hypothetical protein